MPDKAQREKFHALDTRMRRTVRDFGMVAPGEHVLVAVSGGADSTALLVCLKKLARERGMPLTLTVAHLNHCLRGAEGDADAEFVRRLCDDLEISCVTETIDVRRQAESEGGNLESVARRLRYDFLRLAAARVGAQKIAVGHNRNDQAETVLFRLLRGAGVQGLAAIRPVRGNTPGAIVIRPLIDCPRELIREYLEHEGIGWREDSTNADLGYARNRIRRELLPYLEKNFNPRVIDTLAREAALAHETWDFLETQAVAASAKLVCEKGAKGKKSAKGEAAACDEQVFSVAELSALHPALQKQVLRRALRERLGSLEGIGATHIESLVALSAAADGDGEANLPCGLRGLRQFDRLIIRGSQPPDTPEFSCELAIPGECFVAEIGAKFRCTVIRPPADMKIEAKGFDRRVMLNSDALPTSLTVRSRKPGDRYGGAGHRKVKKLLIDNKVPRERRAALPMIAVRDATVVWIPGFKPASGYMARPDAEKCVLLEVLE